MTATDRRGAILQAAARLFEHYGYAKTTMADVAREAQIGVGTVYLEFESKEAIVQELSLGAHAGVLDAMRAADRGTDWAARITSVLMARTECFLRLRSKGQHACELLHKRTEGVRVATQSFHRAEHALFVSLLDQGVAAGAFGRVDSARTATLIQRAFSSLSPPWIFGDDETGPSSDDTKQKLAIASDLCRLLLDGIRAREPSRSTKARRASSAKARARRNRLG